ncbi:SDR family NAD(P)-dependent oxidoreductase [Amycolatopsis pithecellobii]|uniref:SDR family NAD(P)-dependent oxidoreductase n=1 Tax=Amycolatopsis pithecellobii TaxID=664692 RepID=A0A6N7Z9L3_9PSEU|nr:SDR family NAD(P)-dependent oxidoreductase [Amycolatopsis pithecellobii]MTD58427.1 SDR family NAD(P)-dependent oxidoreductase [Amycolatopsis pithecellobii]
MGRLSRSRVLVTGADGFIGSHLVERLLSETASVRALCVYNSNGSYGWLDELESSRVDDIDVRLGDVRDSRFVQDTVRGVDIVFHLAALIAIPYSYISPSSYVDTNVMGTLNVLEAVREAGEVRMVNTSTSEVYGTPETVPISEKHPLRGQSPYAATKIAADQLCESFARSFGTPVVTLRPFNTFGPRQSARAVLPTILGQLLAGAKQVSLGNLSPRRDLTYVADTVEGFVRMAEAEIAPGSLVQLGTGNAVSVRDLFDLCCEATGADAEVVVDESRIRPQAGEVHVLLSDPGRARETLGWEPRFDLAKGIAETARWLEARVVRHRALRYQR